MIYLLAKTLNIYSLLLLGLNMDKIEAINLLKDKAEKLGKIPKKSDFLPGEICLIKAKLGPWNRALEQAGLKEISAHYLEKKEKVKQKRQLKKQLKSNKNADKNNIVQ